MHTCKHKWQVLCTSLTSRSEGHEKSEQNQGTEVPSQITSVFTLRFSQRYLKTLSSQHT